jgi:ABC-type transport system involved in cytochrome c biogenesis ATPase subunit
MYIHRIILRDVRNFENLDLRLWNDWTNKPLDSVLLTGSNGSGKTTVLRVIAALWENFSGWLRFQKTLSKFQQAQKGFLLEAGLAAIELRDLEDFPVWLYVAANPEQLEHLQSISEPNAQFVGEVRGKLGRPSFDQQDWLERLENAKRRLDVGVDDAKKLPNLVFLKAENRDIIAPRSVDKIFPDVLDWWLPAYEAQDRFQGHIESMFQNVQIRSEAQFKAICNQINPFLGGTKKITGFDANLRLKVQLGDKRTNYHYLDALSSGEKQCVIMMFMVSRWLMPGGVVLIDEPDLHLHVSLQRHFIHELEKVVHAKGGQLIITSHSPTMWEEFNLRQSIDLEHGVMADVE